MKNWKELQGYNGKYFISDLGNVKTKHKNGTETISKGSISKSTGYYRKTLCNDLNKKVYEIHKLVAICFLNHTPNGLKIVVDHIDNNKLNNKVCNLQTISHRLNTQKNRINKNKILGIKQNNGKFEASIKINGKKIYLGLFNTDIEAGEIYQKANSNLNFYNGNPKDFRNYLKETTLIYLTKQNEINRKEIMDKSPDL
jgi:hypothetical protein